MVPGTVERDRFTSREQWNDWWRVTSPPAGRALYRVNAGALWRWRPTRLWQAGSRQPERRSASGWVRSAPGREALTGY
jgi:hypothetical protein